ncbi:hypothetical protein B0675_40035 [Streptomyces sp. M41(2017)]|uniref:hypothetical protein n=1 Tax=Streptomyces sp. M41(2017) TaxID=1955065 RepID=UPI0009C010EE|nr:hypothetical protein [Streptomyces sp. M41(2017)]OQQ13010.1 hypothetical protein B0675_40035 [Streptomyces sp. M41(2017)]
MIPAFPPMPDQDVPFFVQTSGTYDTDDWGDLERHGIDPDRDWWCEVVLRTRRSDAIASLYPPGAQRHQPLVEFILGADDLYEAEAVAHRAIRVGRSIAALLVDPADAAAWQALRGQGLPAAHVDEIRSWLRAVEELGHRWEPLTLEASGWAGELWTVSMIAEYLGYEGASATNSARVWLSRKGIKPEGRQTGRHGQTEYDADLIRQAKEASPGKGRRGAQRTGGRFTGAATPSPE